MRRLGRAFRLAVRSLPVTLPLLLAAGVAGWFGVQKLRLEWHHRAAARAHDREEFAEAGEHLAACMRLDPDSAKVQFLAARVARRSTQYDFAEQLLVACEDLGVDPKAVRLERTLLAFQRGEPGPDDERTLHESVTADNPDRFLILEAMALGYMRSYRLKPALRCLELWAEGQPDAFGPFFRRAWVNERLERFDEAIDDYRRAVRLKPGHREARLQLGHLLQLEKRPAEAAEVYEEMLARAEGDAAARLGLAQSRLALGQVEESRRLLEGLTDEASPDPVAMLERGKLALSEGRLAEAREWLGRAAEASPRSLEAQYQLFLCLRRQGEKEEAARVERRFQGIEADLKKMHRATQALQKRPDDTSLWQEIGEVYLRSGEGAEALRWLGGVVRAEPDNRKARELLAEACERSGLPHEARRHREALGGGAGQ